ncbi:uncharacterized protein PG998_013089 [Apiospora kogelbergensis]|uniref:uncharacterized protein n=1 Tax=Apiospora kogelbergensis TaxID=1337665 RepID=UPI003130606B
MAAQTKEITSVSGGDSSSDLTPHPAVSPATDATGAKKRSMDTPATAQAAKRLKFAAPSELTTKKSQGCREAQAMGGYQA